VPCLKQQPPQINWSINHYISINLRSNYIHAAPCVQFQSHQAVRKIQRDSFGAKCNNTFQAIEQTMPTETMFLIGVCGQKTKWDQKYKSLCTKTVISCFNSSPKQVSGQMNTLYVARRILRAYSDFRESRPRNRARCRSVSGITSFLRFIQLLWRGMPNNYKERAPMVPFGIGPNFITVTFLDSRPTSAKC
jgi:hypothetical protein